MEMTTSMEIGSLAAALAKAQAKMTGALKDSANPFYKSKYADLASVWDAARGPVSENELAVIQTTENGESGGLTVVTTLAHSSGQWIRGRLTMWPKDGSPQAIGSCITYARRYALAAILGIAQVDDDANAASGHTKATPSDGIDLSSVDDGLVREYVERIKDKLEAGDAGGAGVLWRELNRDEQVAAWKIKQPHGLNMKQKDVLRGLDKEAA